MAETYRPPQGVRDEAKRALAWIADGKAGDGFTDTGRARAVQLANGDAVSADTILRMYSFFARHEGDKQGAGFKPGDDGYPSAGRVAWAAWGGDPGYSWASKIREQLRARAALLEGGNVEKRDVIAIDELETTPDLGEELLETMADVVVLYFRAHGAHWNVKGSDFSEYHALFNEIYEDIYSSIDPLAENLRKLGIVAPFRLVDFIELSTLQDANPGQDALALARDLLNANDVVIDNLSDAFDCATYFKQQGIANFLADRLDKHQFWKWQLTASLGEEITEPSPDPVNAQGVDEDDVSGVYDMGMMRSATGDMGLPVAGRSLAWDSSAAEGRVRAWAGGDDIDWSMYGKAFFYFDNKNPENFGSYKLQFADIVQGQLQAVPKAIFAVAAVLNGSRGGVDIPSADADAIKKKVSAYYDKMATEFDDASLVAPFEGRAAQARLGVGTFVSWPSGGDRANGKIEKVVTSGPAASSDNYILEATSDDPAYIIRIFKKQGNGFIPTEQTVVHRADLLNVISSLPAPRSQEMDMIEERKSAIATADKVTFETEIRTIATTDGSLRIGGYAAQFNQEATGLNFREMIAPGAFKRSLDSGQPVFLLINHDTDSLPLASTQSGTMMLSEDNVGLRMEATLDPNNPRAVELASALERGDVNKMSFAFTIAPGGDSRKDGLRTLSDVNLFEVSVVTWPAYDSTDVGMRTADAESAELEALELRRRKLALQSKFLNK